MDVFRYFSLSKPDNRFFSARGARLAIIAVWVGMVATGVPLLIWCDLVKAGTSIACTTRRSQFRLDGHPHTRRKDHHILHSGRNHRRLLLRNLVQNEFLKAEGETYKFQMNLI